MLDENKKHARIDAGDGSLTSAGYSWDVLVKAATRIVDTVNRSALANESLNRTRTEEHEAPASAAHAKLREALNLNPPPVQRPLPPALGSMLHYLIDIEGQDDPETRAWLEETEHTFRRYWDWTADDCTTQLALPPAPPTEADLLAELL